MPGCKDYRLRLGQADWMRAERIWPNGLRYTVDGCLRRRSLVSLYAELDERRFLDEAEWLVAEVDRVLGRPRGLRIGEAPDRDGQYFPLSRHVALCALRPRPRTSPDYGTEGIALAPEIHDAFVVPGRGVIWKMREDLSAPYPGFGFGALDAFDGYVSYRFLDEQALSREIADMRLLIEITADLVITQDLGLGMMLWMTHFFPGEDWA